MDLGSIFLILALALLVAIFVTRPLYDRKIKAARLLTASAGGSKKRAASPDQEKHHSSLLAERERLLNALQELEFDFNLGKIPAEDYPEQRDFLLKSGAKVLRELDEMENSMQAEPAEARIEAEVEKISLTGSASPSREMVELEALIAERRRKREEKSSGFCPKCGKALQVSDTFCPRCGTKR